ncbi:MAG: ATP-dependent helicase, partial [Anaerolineae bacterium]|nr:ATP-dependent helicase [Anaerolineae bacterium]
AAVARTLRKMRHSPRYATSQAQLDELIALAAQIESSSKTRAVLQILDQVPGKLLVFTDYRRSMNSLYEAISKTGIPAVQFHGGMSALEKEKAVRAFRREARVMISTESGAEGRNLQFCHQMVNYDLPWNPMRIEQRIGRIHRLGQTHEVLIFNLAGKETIEAQILDLLARKIRMFELVVGELDLILGAMETRRSFEALLRDAWLGSQNDRELAEKIADLERLIDASQRTFERIQETSVALSDLLTAKEEIQEDIRNARKDVPDA